MAKETKEKVYDTPFHNMVVEKLKAIGYGAVEENRVAISVDNRDDVAGVYYNFTATGIHLDKNEFDPFEVTDAGFHYWSTWHWGECC